MAEHRKFTRGQFFGRDGGLIQKRSSFVMSAPNIQRGETYPQESGPTLPEGWTEYKPVNGQDVPVDDVIKHNIPLSHPEKIQLSSSIFLQTMTGKKYLNTLYPSLAKYYNESDTADDLKVYSYTDEKNQIKSEKVNIIYAIANAEHNTGDVARTQPRIIDGNKVIYDLIILLNPPVSKNFKTTKEYTRWIEALYAHEKIHVFQMARRHKLLGPNATRNEIVRAFDGSLLQDEAEAYWAMLTYGKIRNLEWFTDNTSPFGNDLKVPFEILQKKGIDPLESGKKNDEQNKYESLWQYVIYTHIPFAYRDLIYQSKTMHPEYISMMEQCYQEGLITESKFTDYIQQVDPTRYERFMKIKDFKINAGSLFSPEVKLIAGIVALSTAGLVGFRIWRGK